METIRGKSVRLQRLKIGSSIIILAETDDQSILKYMVSSGLGGGVIAARPRKQVLQLLYTSGLMADK